MKIFDRYASHGVTLPQQNSYTLYVCGVTPYDAAHIGHAATFTYFDVLIRLLEHDGATVHYVQNITDVDDSIIAFAKKSGQDLFDVATKEESKLLRAFRHLGLRFPDTMPKVSTSINAIITKVEELNSAGVLYQVGNDWYFDTSRSDKFAANTHLSHMHLEELFNERGGNTEIRGKRNTLDFIVWQHSLDGEPVWESKLGPGRPGWHIECTAMLLDAFVTTVDIHGGGEDLFFPHHVCEQAQSRALGIDTAKTWMHVGLVSYRGHKMSKSLGNLVYVEDALQAMGTNALKIAILSHEYAQGFDWNDQLITQSIATCQLITQALRLPITKSTPLGPITQRVVEALGDNLDTPTALGVVSNRAQEILAIQALSQLDMEDYIESLHLLGFSTNHRDGCTHVNP